MGKYTPEQVELLARAYREILSWPVRPKQQRVEPVQSKQPTQPAAAWQTPLPFDRLLPATGV